MEQPTITPLAVDDLKNTRVMSRDEPMENIAAPGVPKVGDNGQNATVKVKQVSLDKCSGCGELVTKTWRFCPSCGIELNQKCKCGAENQTGAFCSACGKKLKRGKAR
jgi:hypothetical protein